MQMHRLFDRLLFGVPVGILRRAEDAAVAVALFGDLFFERRFARADAVVGAFALFRRLADHHEAGTVTLSVDQFVAGESHRDALVDLLVGILDETELLVDLVDEFPGLFEFSLKFVGVDIDCLHALLLKKICRHCNKIFVLGYNNGKHEKKEDAMPQKATDAPQADKDVEALRKEIETLKKDLLKLTETLGKIGEEKIRSSVDEVKEKVVSQIPKEQLEQLEAVKAQGEEAIEMIKQQQKEHPVGTLLVAAGIGFLLGKVLGGKSG